jgi:ribonuclease G
MVSEPMLPAAHEEAQGPAPIEMPEPTSPMRFEGAVVMPETRPGFEPGAGELTEEELDDEDFASTIHASSIEELDDLDEETLEGAADLGTMLREMSIDQITRSSPEIEEEDDLEEDDLDEDDEEDQGEGEGEVEGFEIDDREEVAGEEGHEASAAPMVEGLESQTGEAGRSEAGTPRKDGERFGRRDGRRDGRHDGRGGRDRGDRPRGTGDRERGRSKSDSGERSGFSNGGGRNRSDGSRSRTMQSTNLPAISDLLKPGQEILVQIAKEPMAKKGARITSHIALPGRFLVFMPTVNHTGVSRKI